MAVAEESKSLVESMRKYAIDNGIEGFEIIRDFHRTDEALANLAAVRGGAK